jgi:hypothetical protein
MSMTYIIGKKAGAPEAILSVEVNSTTDAYLSELLSLALEEKYPELYEKITEQVIFIRFDELAKEEFHVVKHELEILLLASDASEGSKGVGAKLWGELIQPLMDLDSRN